MAFKITDLNTVHSSFSSTQNKGNSVFQRDVPANSKNLKVYLENQFIGNKVAMLLEV